MDNQPSDTEQTVKPAQIARRRISRRLGKEQYERSCCIYFIEAVGMNLIKIGYAIDPVRRFMGLLTSSPAPLSLLGTLPGGPQREIELHAQLEEHRVHGEWFYKAPEVMAIAATVEPIIGQDVYNMVAKRRGDSLRDYLAKMKRGEVVRPTRGPNKPRPPRPDRYGNLPLPKAQEPSP